MKKEKCPWLHRALFILLVVGTILATMRYDVGRRIGPDCQFEDIGYAQRC